VYSSAAIVNDPALSSGQRETPRCGVEKSRKMCGITCSSSQLCFFSSELDSIKSHSFPSPSHDHEYLWLRVCSSSVRWFSLHAATQTDVLNQTLNPIQPQLLVPWTNHHDGGTRQRTGAHSPEWMSLPLRICVSLESTWASIRSCSPRTRLGERVKLKLSILDSTHLR